MATTKLRVSVVRIPRQTLNINQINPTENHDDTVKDQSNSQPKSHHHHPNFDKISTNKTEENEDIPRTKTDVFKLSPPRISVTKADDVNRQAAYNEPLRHSITIQQQPTQTDTWTKRSSNNILGSANNITQPSNKIIRPEFSWRVTGKWSHGICSLCEDMNMCCYACACWCCFRHEISSMMGEHWCIWFANCTPLMELRTKFRQQYSIKGSIAEDFCYATFCPLCAALQLANEGRDYGHRIFS